MAVDKKCLACDVYRDECTGLEEACACFTPIDYTRTTAGSAEPKEVPAQELIPLLREPVGETRREKFARIGKKRQEQALEAIRKMMHLTSRYHRKGDGVTAYTYEWTAKEAIDLIKPITEALANLQAELIACDIPYENGMIEEKNEQA